MASVQAAVFRSTQDRVRHMLATFVQSPRVQNFSAMARKWPYLASGCTSSVFLMAADVGTQCMLSQEDSWDRQRTLSMFLWGLCWYGGPQQFYWMQLYPRLFGRGTVPSAMKTTIADCVVNPMISYVPCFYIFTGAVKGQSTSESTALLSKEYLVTCFGFSCYWIPVQFANFYIMPPHINTYVVSVANVFHKMWLSWLSNRDRVQENLNAKKIQTNSGSH